MYGWWIRKRKNERIPELVRGLTANQILRRFESGFALTWWLWQRRLMRLSVEQEIAGSNPVNHPLGICCNGSIFVSKSKGLCSIRSMPENARVVELVDTTDLKSVVSQGTCRFKSGSWQKVF